MAAVTQWLGATAVLSSANCKKFQFTTRRSLSGKKGSFFIVESNGNPRSGLNRHVNRTRQLATNAVATMPDSTTASTISKPGHELLLFEALREGLEEEMDRDHDGLGI